MAYSKSAFAKQLGISGDELAKRAKSAGFDTTEAYYKSTGGTGTTAQQQSQNQVTNEKAQISDYLSRKTTAIKAQPTIQDVWNRISKEQGLDVAGQNFRGLSSSASQLQQTAEQMPEQVAGETRGYDVSSSQLQRLAQARQGEVYKQLTPVAREAGIAGQNLSSLTEQGKSLLTAEMYQQEKDLQPFADEAELLNSSLARQATYYTTDKQNQFNLMLQNLQSGQAVDNAELERIGELALLEKEYELQKDMYKYQQSFKTTTGDKETFKI